MNVEQQKMIGLLKQLSSRTAAGEIEWAQPNPATFQYATGSDRGPLVVTIQRALLGLAARLMGANAPNVEADYLFQVQEAGAATGKRVVVSLSSKERPELSDALEELYSCAEDGIDRQTNQILQKLL